MQRQANLRIFRQLVVSFSLQAAEWLANDKMNKTRSHEYDALHEAG